MRKASGSQSHDGGKVLSAWVLEGKAHAQEMERRAAAAAAAEREASAAARPASNGATSNLPALYTDYRSPSEGVQILDVMREQHYDYDDASSTVSSVYSSASRDAYGRPHSSRPLYGSTLPYEELRRAARRPVAPKYEARFSNFHLGRGVPGYMPAASAWAQPASRPLARPSATWTAQWDYEPPARFSTFHLGLKQPGRRHR